MRNQLNAAQAEWANVEPKVTAAQKRAEELTKTIDSTKVLDGLIETRFYWAPLLGKLAGCVAPNIQLVGLDGNVSGAGDSGSLVIEGLSAAREPRAAAEEFRQAFSETLTKNYTDVKVAFRNLEDLDTLATSPGCRPQQRVSSSAFPLIPNRLNPEPSPRKPRRRRAARNEDKKMSKDEIQKNRPERDRIRRADLLLLHLLPRPAQQEPRDDDPDHRRDPGEDRFVENRDAENRQPRAVGERGDNPLRRAQGHNGGRRAHRLVPAEDAELFCRRGDR